MRWTIVIVLSALAACGKGENAGRQELAKQAEAEQKAKESSAEAPKKLLPPVPGSAHLPCSQVIDADKFQQALGEKDPLEVAEDKSEPDAAASCALRRGGKKLTDAEQKAIVKQTGKLGIVPGDDICVVSLFCWTIEDPDRFHKKCADQKDQDDDSLGFYSCVHVVPEGEMDKKNYRFFDDDTKCIFQVRGGPSNLDNDLIAKCAKTAHDLIGPEQIAVKK